MIKIFSEFLVSSFENRNLILELSKREFTDRYVGQVLGKLWIFLHPILLMSVYLFVFVFVFKVKVQGVVSISNDYSTYLLSGLIAWLVVQEVLSKSTTAITSNASLVKQVVFPLEVLPIKIVISSLVTMLVFILSLLAYTVIVNNTYSLMLLLIPILIYMQIIFMIGISFILSSIGVYLKDVKDLVQMFGFIGVFLLPVMYLPSQIPSIFEPLIYSNPFTYLIFCYQDVFFYGDFTHWYAWIVLFVMSHIVLIFGYSLFKKLKIMFGDVL